MRAVTAKSMTRQRLFALMVTAALVAGCQPADAAIEETLTPEATTAEATTTPTAESSPEPTPTPTPDPLSMNLYMVPPPEGALMRMGKSHITGSALSPSGEYLAIAAEASLCLYEVETMQELWCSPAKIRLFEILEL